jgi:hypothetical protein
MSKTELRQDRIGTVVFLVCLLPLMVVLSILPAMSLHSVVCINHPGECNEALLAFANFMGGPAKLIIFGAAVLVSVVLFTRRQRAFYVPLIAGAAMFGCFVVWMILVRNGFLIPYS